MVATKSGHAGKAEAEIPGDQPLAIGAEGEQHGNRGADGGHIRRGLHADGQHQSGAQAGEQCRRPARWRFKQQAQTGHAQHQLDIVVIERARRKNAEEIQCGSADHDSGQHGAVTGKAARGASREKYGQAEEQRRPQHLRNILGKGRAAGQGRYGDDDGGDRRIDQPRPMHDETAFQAHPVLVEIEPPLAGQHVANFDEAQQIVVVAAGIGQCREAGKGIDGKRQRRGKQRQRDIGPPNGGAIVGCAHIGTFGRNTVRFKPSLNSFNK